MLHEMKGLIKGKIDWQYGRYEGKFRGTSAHHKLRIGCVRMVQDLM
jgi:hypothetical protein